MTNQEAIDYLLDPIGKRDKHDEAVAMAIKALEKESCEDAISRQDAMEAIMKYANTHAFNSYYSGMSRARDIVEKLPSVKPKTHDKRTETHACDCISRQDAINALWKALYDYEDKTEKQFQESEELDIGDWIAHRIFVQNMSDIDRQAIIDLPSVMPKRKEGRWDYIGYNMFRCKSCGVQYTTRQFYYLKNYRSDPEFPEYCPKCGADMRGMTNDSVTTW